LNPACRPAGRREPWNFEPEYLFNYNLIRIIGKTKNFSLIREGGHFQNFIDSQYLSKENQKALTPLRAYDIK